ncbi:conjugal transfer protein TraF [Helicobacter equorum]|uniref:OMP96 n=1 Tax=Helicobacter equorum TaxID=361872 RepID=A0A1M4NGK4_9HELI|nr:conjugal transfer protein TraF [Helicobacter equorum]SFZ71335.1 OMP96 [Helicobacter equorum]
MKKILYVLATCVASMHALEFGTMGNVSASMGGAGVALKNSAFGLYYNPALLSASPKVKFGYSVGVSIQEKNIAQLATIDIANMQRTAQNLASSFGGSGGTGGSGAVDGVAKAVDNALDSVLNSSGSSGSQSTQQKLESYLKTSNGNHNDLIDKIKENVKNSNDLTGIQKDLITGVASGIDFNNLKFDNGTGTNTVNLANAISSITISKGSDKGLDKSMSDIAMVQNALQDNHMNLTSQNGIVLQLGSRPLNDMIGTFAVGLFGSLYSNISLNANPDKLRLIIEAGGQYYELTITDDGYTYGLSNENTYKQHSLIASLQDAQNGHSIYMTSFVLSEIPVGYARTFYLKNGNLNIGIAGKLMNSTSMQNKVPITTKTDFGAEMSKIVQDFKNTTIDKAIGVDVGAVYEIDLPKFRYLTLGLVGKNLNSPTFNSTLQNITIKPQARAGIAYYTQSGFNLAFDVDLTQNDIIAFSTKDQKSQMIGGGAGFIWKGFDLRLGAMKDLRQDNGLILTGGVNVLGIIDIALQSSTKFTKIQNYPIPQYLSLRVGGSLSW